MIRLRQIIIEGVILVGWLEGLINVRTEAKVRFADLNRGSGGGDGEEECE